MNNTILQTTPIDFYESINKGNITGITPVSLCENLNECNITGITPVSLCESLNKGNVIRTTPDMIANFTDQEAEFWPNEIDTEFLVNVL